MKKIFEKLFLSAQYFTIALRPKESKSIVEAPLFNALYVFPSTLSDWVADPVMVDYEGKTYMFYEAVKGEKGRIEVVEILSDCTPSRPVVVLEDDYHYSYPFVFQHNGSWFMIPESSAKKEVALYCATQFPYVWKKQTVLLAGSRAVDTTVFFAKDNIYLLTYVPNDITEHVTPRAYLVNWENGVHLSEIPWKNTDPLKTRGAGALFANDNVLYRPAQINEATRYGDGVAFYKVNPTNSEYAEALVSTLMPSQLHVPKTVGTIYNGLHTYAVSERFEAIDIRCRDVDMLKLWRRMRRKVRFSRNTKE